MAFDTKKMAVDYKALRKMVPTERTNMAKRGMIDELLNALTPTQVANLFPRYYREQIPSMSGFTSAMTSGGSGGGGGGGNTTGGSSADYQKPQRVNNGGGNYQPPQGYNNTPIASRNLTARQTALLNIITGVESTAAGMSAYDVTFGRSSVDKANFITPEKMFGRPLTDLTINEVRKYQNVLRAETRAAGIGKINGETVGTSAVGRGQWVGGTLTSMLAELGIHEKDYDSVKLTPELQDRLFVVTAIKKRGLDPDKIEQWINDDNAIIGLGQEWEGIQKLGIEETRRRLQQVIAAPANTVQSAMGPDASSVDPNAPEMQTAEPLPNGVNQGGVQPGVFPEGSAVPVSDDFSDLQGALGQQDVFEERSSQGVKAAGIANIDHRLVKVGDAGIRAFEKLNPGWKVRVISGKRTPGTNSGSATSRHLRGGAVDYEIVDPQGNVLPNLGGGDSGVGSEAGSYAPKYQELGRYMEAARQKMAKDDPSYAEAPVAQGLYFGGEFWVDSMHMQLGGNTALGDTVGGFKDPEQLRREGQPEYIIRAVEKAQAAGATSLQSEEMQNITNYIYENADIPVETLVKLNSNIARTEQAKAQREQTAPAQTETASPVTSDAPGAPPSTGVGALPPESSAGTQPGIFAPSSPQTQNNTPANPPLAPTPEPSLPPASGSETVVPPTNPAPPVPAYTSGVNNKDMGNVQALIPSEMDPQTQAQKNTGTVESTVSSESPTGESIEPIKIVNDRGLVASMRPDEGIKQNDNGTTSVVPQTQMNARQQGPSQEVSSRRNPEMPNSPNRSLSSYDKIAGDSHTTPSFSRAISRAVGKDIKSHFGVN